MKSMSLYVSLCIRVYVYVCVCMLTALFATQSSSPTEAVIENDLL